MFASRGASIMRPALNFSGALRSSAFARSCRQQSTKAENFFVKQARLNRPMSPHLTIYKPQLTAMLSITHRGTGVAWTVAMATFGIGTMVAGKPFAEILEDIKKLEIPPACFYATKFVLTWPFAYHTVNGVRHMVWDRALALTIPGVYNTGYAAVAVSTAIAGLITTL